MVRKYVKIVVYQGMNVKQYLVANMMTAIAGLELEEDSAQTTLILKFHMP